MINQNWVFGKNARVKFGTPTPTSDPTSELNNPSPYVNDTTHIYTHEGCASISDANGDLVLYTDGQSVWDRYHNRFGSNLKGHKSSTQSAIIVPNPGHPAQYYIVTADGATGGNNHVHFYLVKTYPQSSTSCSCTPYADVHPALPPIVVPALPHGLSWEPTERVTAIQHKNCVDFWVVTIVRKVKSGATSDSKGAVGAPGTLRVFLVNSTGVKFVRDINIPEAVKVYHTGYLKGSRDGERIAFANAQGQNVLVYPFDNSHGEIDVALQVNIVVPAIAGNPDHARTPYGVEFSPNSKVLYYTVLGAYSSGDLSDGYVFQHNLQSSSTSVLVGHHKNEQLSLEGDIVDEQGRYALGTLQLGMNDRIYIALDGEAWLGEIADPNKLGTDCTVNFNKLALPTGSICYMGLPNLIPNACDFGCDDGCCDKAVDAANLILGERTKKKSFTIMADGQETEVPCGVAFEQINFEPRFSLHWGDSLADQFESHDTEIIYIRIRNPFMNLIYRGVKILNIQIAPNQVLADGENALQLIPAEIVCFDDIEPCSSVSRDFAFLIQNAVARSYQITFEYCIDEIAICGCSRGSKAFGINVVAS